MKRFVVLACLGLAACGGQSVMQIKSSADQQIADNQDKIALACGAVKISEDAYDLYVGQNPGKVTGTAAKVVAGIRAELDAECVPPYPTSTDQIISRLALGAGQIMVALKGGAPAPLPPVAPTSLVPVPAAGASATPALPVKP